MLYCIKSKKPSYPNARLRILSLLSRLPLDGKTILSSCGIRKSTSELNNIRKWMTAIILRHSARMSQRRTQMTPDSIAVSHAECAKEVHSWHHMRSPTGSNGCCRLVRQELRCNLVRLLLQKAANLETRDKEGPDATNEGSASRAWTVVDSSLANGACIVIVVNHSRIHSAIYYVRDP
jgi:hypothetical protein